MPEMIRILCEGLATVLFALICTRFLCKNMKKRDFRFVPWLPYVLTGCGSAMLFLLGGLSPWTFCGMRPCRITLLMKRTIYCPL